MATYGRKSGHWGSQFAEGDWTVRTATNNIETAPILAFFFECNHGYRVLDTTCGEIVSYVTGMEDSLGLNNDDLETVIKENLGDILHTNIGYHVRRTYESEQFSGTKEYVIFCGRLLVSRIGIANGERIDESFEATEEETIRFIRMEISKLQVPWKKWELMG